MTSKNGIPYIETSLISSSSKLNIFEEWGKVEEHEVLIEKKKTPLSLPDVWRLEDWKLPQYQKVAYGVERWN